jgi:hypothetical protein
MKKKGIYYFAGLIIILIIIFLFLKLRPNKVYSGFNNGDEGWQVVGDVQNSFAKPEYHNTGGNPGGCLSATDETTGGVWYWSAPHKFLGSKKRAFNKKIEFELKQSDLHNQFEAVDIILESGDLSLVYSLPKHPDTAWTKFSVVLSADTGWKKNSEKGDSPTDQDFKKVLSSLSGLKIRGEYITGPDFGYIDNVYLYLK